jgi:hypothetical protein
MGGRPFICVDGQKAKSKWGTQNLEAYLAKLFPESVYCGLMLNPSPIQIIQRSAALTILMRCYRFTILQLLPLH